jgi:hypothetical protein
MRLALHNQFVRVEHPEYSVAKENGVVSTDSLMACKWDRRVHLEWHQGR